VHNIWQVDAKEQLRTLDGHPACYLTLTDEKSGCWLGSLAFAYARICQVPLAEVRQRLIESFHRWGKAGAFRVDNGEPLGTPTLTMTSALSLWLIAMDVDVIFNKPRCPQQNAVVEKMQCTSSRWAEVHRATDLDDLQKRLDRESVLQRQGFSVKRLQGRTRLDAFPEIETSRRVYSHPEGSTATMTSTRTGSTGFSPRNSTPAKCRPVAPLGTTGKSIRSEPASRVGLSS